MAISDVLLGEAEHFLRSRRDPVPDAVLYGIFELVAFSKSPSEYCSSPTLGRALSEHAATCLEFLLRLLATTEEAFLELCKRTRANQTKESLVNAFSARPRMPSLSSTAKDALTLYDDLCWVLEDPCHCFNSSALASAFGADRRLCLQLCLHLVRYAKSILPAPRWLLEDKEINVAPGKVVATSRATAAEFAGHLRAAHGVFLSDNSVNKYIRQLHCSAPATFDTYYRFRMLSTHTKPKRRKSSRKSSVVLLDPHLLAETLESMASSTSEITVRIAQKTLKRFRHPGDLKQDRYVPPFITISASAVEEH